MTAKWELKHVDVCAFEDEGLSVHFNERVDTLVVKDDKIVVGHALRHRVYDKVTVASADRLQKALENTDFRSIRHYIYHDGIIVEYRAD